MGFWEGNFKLYTQIICIAFFFMLEWIVPYFEQREGKILHDVKNLTIATINGVLGSLIFASLIIWMMLWAESANFGILYWLGIEYGLLRFVVAFLLFDLWMYWWHRINHVVPMLWKFHRVHHTDPAMNASTGLRFHPVEIMLSFTARLFVLPLIGMTFEELVVYEVVLQTLVVLQHSNVFIVKKADDLFRLVFVSPHMHKVHHSELIHETNSNYSSVFSFWDRIFGSHVYRDDVHNIRYGTGNYEEEQFQSLQGLLKLPFIDDEKKVEEAE